MSSTFRRGDNWFIKVPIRTGAWITRTTGTRDKSVASAMGRMIDDLGPRGRRAWELLCPLAAGTLSVAELYDSHCRNELDALRNRLSDVDLEPYVDGWLTAIEPHTAQDTRDHYQLYVRSFVQVGERFPRSDLTHARIVQWLATRKVGRSTKRKYHASLSGFCEYLKAVGVLERNPMRDVKAPAPAAPRMRYLDQSDVNRLIGAQAHPYDVLSALLHGTGMEVSVGLGLKRRDVDVHRREVMARGTKTHARDRIARVAEWAWPMVEAHTALLTPNAPLFPGINRWTASDKHREACKALEIEEYQLKDSRHTYAVRAIRAGAAFEVVARQLGHADTTMVVRVYGRFKPSEAEMTDWERIAAAQDQQRLAR